MFPLPLEVACVIQIIVIKFGLVVDPIKKLSPEFHESTQVNLN
jgi:hypothetical protein